MAPVRYKRIPFIRLAAGRIPVYRDPTMTCQHGEFQTLPRERITVGPQGDSTLYATLLHESLHAISDRHGLGLTERAVRSLEVELCALIARNPKLIKGISKHHAP